VIKRALGRTGYQISEVGFGTWGLPGSWWKGVDPAAAQRALYRAVECGLDFIDTALAYGDGGAEILVGEVVKSLRARDRVVVATKVPPANGEWPGDGDKLLQVVFPVAFVQAQVEQSLRNLRLEALPLCQLHVWHDQWLDSPTWPELEGTLHRLIREGKVLHWGISINHLGAGDSLRAAGEAIFETAQVIYNLFDRSVEPAFLAEAKRHNLGVIARCPLDEGALGGNLGAGTIFPLGDWRSRYFRGDRLGEVARRVAALVEFVSEVPPAALSSDAARGIAEAARQRRAPHLECRTLAELALRFCLSRDEVSVVIPGMRQAHHVDANLAVSDGRRLPAALLEQLAAHAWVKDWYAR
jgi:aryl-alcohol dehydrogenase-like predicted oxidoreductase